MFKLNVTLATSFEVEIDIRKPPAKEEINVFTKPCFIKTTTFKGNAQFVQNTTFGL